MASSINASTSTGLVTTADNSGILKLQTANTDAITIDASQNVNFAGNLTVGNVATERIVLSTAQASTSGTTVNFTSIPSWVKRITVMLYSVSTNGTSVFRIRVGSGTLSTSGYASYSTAVTASSTGGSSSTAGFDIRTSGAAGASVSGILTLANISGNIWVASGVLYDTDRTIQTAGSISLGGALDLLTLTTANGTDTFDAGSVNILYEG